MAASTVSTRRPWDHRQSVGARRAGYVIAIAVNAALLIAINVWPGWPAVPFLTDATQEVVGFVNASIAVGLAANAVYLLADPRWLRALGDMLTTAVGLVALVRLWQVFPFDFPAGGFDWALLARVLLVVAIVGSVIGILTAMISFVRSLGE